MAAVSETFDVSASKQVKREAWMRLWLWDEQLSTVGARSKRKVNPLHCPGVVAKDDLRRIDNDRVIVDIASDLFRPLVDDGYSARRQVGSRRNLCLLSVRNTKGFVERLGDPISPWCK